MVLRITKGTTVMSLKLGNLGKVDPKKLERLARLSGISREELYRALREHRIQNLVYSSGPADR